MDSYIASLPEDQAPQIIRGIVRERDGFDEDLRPRKRAKQNASNHVASDIEEEEELQPPIPEDDLRSYDRPRLLQGLRYLTQESKRDNTPRAHVFLQLHLDAHEVALQLDSPQDASRTVVQVLDKAYYFEAFLFKPHQEIVDRGPDFVVLRRLELFANYGDYVGQDIQEIRSKLKVKSQGADIKTLSTVAWFKAPNRWNTMSEQLRNIKKDGVDASGIMQHVDLICQVLGIDADHIIWLIHEWADRNQKLHNQAREDIIGCDWSALARRLARDYKELANITETQEEFDQYQTTLIRLTDEYFDVGSRDNHRQYFPNQKAKDLGLALNHMIATNS